MVAAWGESDADSSDEESSENEMANLCLTTQHQEEEFFDTCSNFNNDKFCLMAFDDDDEVYSDPIPYEELQSNFDELQASFNELYDESIRIGTSHDKLKKHVASLTKELEDLKIKNKALKETNEDLCKTISKFTQGEENLNKLLGAQKCVFDKAGIGYRPFQKQKDFKNVFIKSSISNVPHSTCTYCNQKGHTQYFCDIKKDVRKGKKIVWIPKYIGTNIQGPT
jgi:hypothetical protein